MSAPAKPNDALDAATAHVRKRPQQARSKATVDAILTATAQMLLHHGFEQTSTNRIAKRAGVSIGSLYQYFPNKASLLTALAERHLEQIYEWMAQELATSTAADLSSGVHDFIAALLRAHSRHADLIRVMYQEVPRDAGTDVLHDHEQQVVKLMHTFLAARVQELRALDLDTTTFALVHGVSGIIIGACRHCPERLADPRLVATVTDICARHLLRDAAADPGA